MKKKVFISIFCLKDIGGISTSAYNLLCSIHDMYEVTLCVVSGFISDRYELPKDIKIINGSSALGDVTIDRKFLSKQSFLRKILRSLRRIQKHFGSHCYYRYLDSIKIHEEYDAALAFTDFFFTDGDNRIRYDYYNITKNVKARVKLAWVHNDPIKLGITKDTSNLIFEGISGIINVSEDGKRIFDTVSPQLSNISYVVYNTYNIDQIKSKAICKENLYENNSNVHFVTVGRVNSKQKRMDRIIEVCRRLKAEGIVNFDWTIVGDGEDKQKMISDVKKSKLETIVQFVGLKSNPYPYISQADAFVLTSAYEGLPMTVKEAQILGIPTLVTRFGSAKEAVIEGKQGVICDNSTDGVYNMIKEILLEPQQLQVYKDYLNEFPVSNNVAIRQINELI